MRRHTNHFLDIPLANRASPLYLTATAVFSSASSSSASAVPTSSSASSTAANHSFSPYPSAESTRVELQRQRYREHNAAKVVSNRIPGFRTSAAFLGSLRTNLRLYASPPPSPLATPPSMRSSAASLPPPSPLATPVDSVMGDVVPSSPAADDPLAGVPELVTYRATEDADKVAALKLVADSVAQMRQTANNALIRHPLNLTLAVALIAALARYLTDRGRDWITVLTSCSGVLMVLFALCRYATTAYLSQAEAVNWAWLGDSADVLVTKFGDEIIAAVVLAWVSGESRQKRKKAWRGEIMAWTVRMRYRRKGVGTALLEDAVKEAKKKGAETLEFAEDHAHALRVLPGIYNSGMDARDRKGRLLLEELWQSSPSRAKRK